MTITIEPQLNLTRITSDDTPIIFNTINSEREHLSKWLPFVEHTKEISDTQNFVDSILSLPEENGIHTFRINKDGQFAGLIGLKETDIDNKKTEIGYWLSEKFQGQGIMTKAVDALCGYAFYTLNLNRIQIKCGVENLPSKNIPKRLGFQLEGIERQGELLTGGIYTDLEIYSLLSQEY